MDWPWTIGILLALIGLGFGVVSVPHNPMYGFSKLLFVVAFVILLGKTIWSAMELAWTPALKIALVGTSGAVGAIALYLALAWVASAQAADNPPTPDAAKPLKTVSTKEAAKSEKGTAASSRASGEVLGLHVAGDHQGAGNPAMKIETHGAANGAEINVRGQPGQSVTGLRINQNGPGTGLEIIGSGTGTGLTITGETAPRPVPPDQKPH